ncbi:MAG: T9SS type A sorting domain-containing protein [Bacteroidota bacterium]
MMQLSVLLKSRLQFLILIVGFSLSVNAQDKSRWVNGFSDDSTFFPIAVWLQNPSYADEYLSTGVNLQIGLWQGPTERQLSDLKSAGLPVICYQNEVALSSSNKDIIVGWLQHPDEPDNAQKNEYGGWGPCVPTDTMISRYNLIRSADTTRPVIISLGQGTSYIDFPGRGSCASATWMYEDYTKAADIVTFDIYPVTSKYEMVQGNLWYVPQGVDNLRNWSNDEKPIWAWIESTHIKSPDTLKPTTHDVRTEVWMALIHGARGFGYFCHEWVPEFNEHAWLDDPEMKAAITNINARVTELAPVLNSPTLETAVTRDLDDIYGIGIDMMVKHLGDTLYILAVGMEDFGSNGASFSIHADTDIASNVIVIGEEREIELTNNSFHDEFDGYAVHLYKIGGVSKEDLVTGVEDKPSVQDREFKLDQNYPNPFSSKTMIAYDLGKFAEIELKVYNSSGQFVTTLVDEMQMPGCHTVEFDASGLHSGFYFYRLKAGKQVLAGEMSLIK